MASSRNKVKGKENLNDGITVSMLGLRLVMVSVVLSLRSGSAPKKINGGVLRNTYIHTYIHTYIQ